MNYDDLSQLFQQHGGVASVNKVAVKDPTDASGTLDDTQNPGYQYILGDGSTITLQAQPNTDQGTVDYSNPNGVNFNILKPFKQGTGSATGLGSNSADPKKPDVRLVDGVLVQQDLKNDPSGQTWIPVAGNAGPVAQQDQIKADIAKEDLAERQKNLAAGAGFVNDQELATIQHQQDQDKAANERLDQQTKAQQATNQLEQDRLDQQKQQDQITNDRLARAQQMQADAQKAANDLAQKRLQLDQAVQNNTMTLDQAKFEYEKEWNNVQAAATNARLALDAATEQNREADAQRTAGLTQRGQDITAADNAGTRALNAANDQLGATDREGSMGADLLKSRAQTANDLVGRELGMVSGNKNFGLGLPNGQLPAGLGAALLSQAQDYATSAMGGADVFKTAQDLVHNANPQLAGTPAGAAYTALAAQMLQAQQAQQAASGATFSAPTGTSTTAAPSDLLAGQPTPDQYQPGGDLPPTSAPNVQVTPTGDVTIHNHFYAPTGTSPSDYQGGLV
jgi:hypothetical protein